MGLGYEELRRDNPDLVYCAITPFGEEGPLRDLPGSELVVQAMAEYTASLGRIGDPPVRVGADIASLNTGIFAAQAILAALFIAYEPATANASRSASSARCCICAASCGIR